MKPYGLARTCLRFNSGPWGSVCCRSNRGLKNGSAGRKAKRVARKRARRLGRAVLAP